MASVDVIVGQMRANAQGVRFADPAKVCGFYFGSPRRTGGSHWVYRTPLAGDPRVNIQNDRGGAKAYQVRQVLRAIDRLEGGDE